MMIELSPFDLNNNSLYGVNLIEAGAGTGKTYTIAGLYLRLVVERKVPVEKILVVTFTDAATQELKERIRNRLKEALVAFEDKERHGESPKSDPLLRKIIESSEDLKRDSEYIEDAIRSFDQAAVFTIHGFCQRMLVENAFESGSLFATELVSDSDGLIHEVITDFWRINIYCLSDLFTEFLILNKIKPDTLFFFIKAGLKPGLGIVPQVELKETTEHEQAFIKINNEVSRTWGLVKNQVEKILMEDPGLNRSRYNKKNIPLWIKILDDYFSLDNSPMAVPDIFEKFSSTSIAGAVKKGFSPPFHEFFNRIDDFRDLFYRLTEVFENNLLAYKIMALDFVKDQLAKRKQEKGILGFDDLLINLHKGLSGENGRVLTEKIQRKFSVALIDEFQDTDPIQYDIFSGIFGTGKSTLFMIGDPKQAIYGFRGADIFAYMNAAKNAESAFTLTRNYRSDPGIIHAVNTIFNRSETPFLFDEIGFYPAEPAGDENCAPIEIEGEIDPPFHLWVIETGEKSISKNEASAIVEDGVTAEISRLLNLAREGKALLDSKPLREKDIAVLVRTNFEAFQIKEALGRVGVPAVIYNTGNVFYSFEAMELKRVLTAIAAPGNGGAVRAALATEMIGLSGEEIGGFDNCPERYDRWKEKFRGYHETWIRLGFINMFNQLVKEEEVLARLMGLKEGDRRSTNLFHLSQLIHRAGIEESLGPEGLIKWLDTRMDPGSPAKEEYQLRLESDADSVKIITIHKSKGLEYPVVFCPYTWSGRSRNLRPEFCVFHNKDNNMALTLDAGSGFFDLSVAESEREELAEDLRLLYVALTRAKSRCYMVWGRVKGAEKTASGYLFHNDGEKVDIPEGQMALMESLKQIEKDSRGTIKIEKVADGKVQAFHMEKDKPKELVLRKFNGKIETDFKIASFSSLTKKIHKEYQEADRDSVSGIDFKKEKNLDDEKPDIFSFPKGAGPGTFMHEIFEHYDFTAGDTELDKLVTDKLNKYGFDLIWKDTISKMVKNVLNTPLDPEDSSSVLAYIKNEDRLNELEFYFPLKHISPLALENIFLKHSVPGFIGDLNGLSPTGRLDFSPVKGFMKGFIDLIFRKKEGGVDRYYIIDWKSNWLGDTISGYNQENLLNAMAGEMYVLQYHLYCAALNRYLKLRVGDKYRYDKNFGGIYYIFLRGVAPVAGPEFGIYRDTPSENLISDLENLLFEEL